jgi:predicted nucleotidyltransferase
VSTVCFGTWKRRPPSAFAQPCSMDDFSAFTDGERKLLEALNRRGVRFILVDLSAAVLQGADTATRDIDLWFEDLSDIRIEQAVREVGGICLSGSFGMRPPQIGGDSVGDRLDVVTHVHGLRTFAEELPDSLEVVIDGVPLRVLRLGRIIASKRAAGRKKDLAVIPVLEEALAAVEEVEDPQCGGDRRVSVIRQLSRR